MPKEIPSWMLDIREIRAKVERIPVIEERVEAIRERLQEGHERFEKHDAQIAKLAELRACDHATLKAHVEQSKPKNNGTGTWVSKYLRPLLPWGK